MESPNTKTKYQLESVQLDPQNLIQLLDDRKLGKPYKWAQKLCGIEFDQKLTGEKSFELCQNTVPELIKQIRSRLHARMKLYHQIQSLEVCKMSPIGSVKISSILQQFVSLSFNEYKSVSYTKKFVDENLINENDLFYRAVVTRGSAKLECYIAVPSNFPSDLPMFALSLDWNDNKFNSENNDNVRVSRRFHFPFVQLALTFLLFSSSEHGILCKYIHIKISGHYFAVTTSKGNDITGHLLGNRVRSSRFTGISTREKFSQKL